MAVIIFRTSAGFRRHNLRQDIQGAEDCDGAVNALSAL